MNSASITQPNAQFSLVHCSECNTTGHSRVEPSCLDHVVLDPVVDHDIANTELFGDLLNSQLLGLLEPGEWNLIAPTDPPNHFRCIRLTFRTRAAFSIELGSDLCIDQTARQVSDAIDNRRTITRTTCCTWWNVHEEVGASIAVPTDVNGELSLLD